MTEQSGDVPMPEFAFDPHYRRCDDGWWRSLAGDRVKVSSIRNATPPTPEQAGPSGEARDGYERVYCVRCGACAGSGTVEEYDTTRGPEGGKYETDCPECGGTGEQRIGKTRDEAERDALLREVGRQMVQMTTTVRGEDEWLAIPELWRQCLEERDTLRAALASPGATPRAPIAWLKPGTNLVVHRDVKSSTNNGHEFTQALVLASPGAMEGAPEVDETDVRLFTETLRNRGTPWDAGCADLIDTLWRAARAQPSKLAAFVRASDNEKQQVYSRVIEKANAEQMKVIAAAQPGPVTVHQTLLDSLSAILDSEEALPTKRRRLSLDERESIDAAIHVLAKLQRRTA